MNDGADDGSRADSQGRRRGTWPLLATLGMLVAGGTLGLVSGGRPWATAETASTFTQTTAEVSGGDLAPLLPAVCLVALAAVVLIPAVRRLGRRVAGAVLVVLGVSAVVSVIMVIADLGGRARRWLTAGAEQVEAMSTSPAWAYAAAVGALAIVIAGVFVAVSGPAWPGMGSRYERGGGASSEGRGSGAEDAGSPKESSKVWDALDRGDDPTA